jgi:N-acetylglucosamine-6-phosphate deacetylase
MNLVKKLLGIENDKNYPQYKNDFIIQFTNCRIVRDNKLINDDLWIRDGLILDPEKIFFDEKSQSNLQIDCNNLILSAGFIDSQINGGFGYDFTSNDNVCIKDKLKIVAKNLLKHGVTAFCPTIVSSENETYELLLPDIIKTSGGADGAAILGAHLEGPFISKEKYGAHDVQYLKTLENGVEDVHGVYGKVLDNIRIVTLAPELDPTGIVVEYLKNSGIIVSIGHSAATLEQGKVSVVHGASYITHLFNAMAAFHHRDPHLFGLLSDYEINKNLFYGIIADGIHTHLAALNVAYRTHPSGLILVTDAISAMGLSEGKVHRIGNKNFEIKIEHDKKHAVVANTNILCGSIATMNECVRIFQNAAQCSLASALNCASENPAKMLNLYPGKGSLNFGTDADFIIIDENVFVFSTFINGDLVWSDEEWNPMFKFKFNHHHH